MMKKIYYGAFALFTSLPLSAQTTVDFESTMLFSNSYDNGANLAGGFDYSGVHFSNYYDTTYFFNTGFAISNVMDTITPGWTNQYSAMPGSGYFSANYAIFYPDGEVDLSSSPRIVQSMRISNTTYAALSMKNGDAVGKKFGSIFDANGNVDGTNGNDYLKLNIYSISLLGETLASMEYYLADFRFADSTQDYILEEWALVDLSSLNVVGENVASLVFDFESSDVGMFGINTPTYFAMDDFIFANGTLQTTELSDKKNWNLYPNPAKDKIYANGISGLVKIKDMNGRIVLTAKSSEFPMDLHDLPAGIYLFIVENSEGIQFKRFSKL